jgi:transcription initiation factor IIF auxiliary subunit
VTTVPDELTIHQWQKYDGEDWWKWAVWIEGLNEALDRIDYVEWILHPSFPKPIRKKRDRASKFRLETGGWGVFQIRARVQLKNGLEIKLRHQLELHYPDGTHATA